MSRIVLFSMLFMFPGAALYANCLFFHSCTLTYHGDVPVVEFACDGQNPGQASCPDPQHTACNADGNGYNCLWFDYQDQMWVMDVWRCGQ